MVRSQRRVAIVEREEGKKYSRYGERQIWWLTPAILIVGKGRQEDSHKFQTRLQTKTFVDNV